MGQFYSNVDKPGQDEIKICLDPRDMNKVIRREHFQMSTVEEITSSLAKDAVCTVLDGFWQIHLDNKSSLLCTFSI